MKRIGIILTAVIAAALSVNISAEEPRREAVLSVKQKDAKLASLRLLAAGMPGRTLQNWMTTGAWKRWNDLYGGLINEKGASPILADFFGTAVLLEGPRTDTSGIAAFYNPYQDSIFLIQTDLSDRIPRIEDFAFLSGTLFRGEKTEKDRLPEAIAPIRWKMDEVLIRNLEKVREVFHSEFPENAKNLSLSKYRSMSSEETVKSVVDNAVLRLLKLLALFKPEAKNDLLKTGELCAVLWEGELPSIRNKFAFPGDDASPAELFVKIPLQIRKSLMPCLYFRNKNGMLLGLASSMHPEFTILISIQQDRKPLFLFLPFHENFLKDLIKK